MPHRRDRASHPRTECHAPLRVILVLQRLKVPAVADDEADEREPAGVNTVWISENSCECDEAAERELARKVRRLRKSEREEDVQDT